MIALFDKELILYYLFVIGLVHVGEERATHKSLCSGSSNFILMPSVECSNPILWIFTGYCIKLVNGTAVSSPVVFSVSVPLKYQAKLQKIDIIYNLILYNINIFREYDQILEKHYLPWCRLHFVRFTL